METEKPKQSRCNLKIVIMKKLCLFFVWLFLISHGFCQDDYDHNWCFGHYAGLDFNNLVNGKPTPFTTQMDQVEGVASISDPTGRLLFYTDGKYVWDSKHDKMKVSGTNNDAVLMGHQSSTQSAVIIPFIHDIDKYYIFTVDQQGGTNGLRYSIVDLDKDKVLQPLNIIVPGCTAAVEKITVVLHADKDKYWLITHDEGNTKFRVVLLDDNGIISTSSYSKGFSYSGIETVGYLKTSIDGSILASVSADNWDAHIFKFDNKTGIISDFFSNSFLRLSGIPTNTYGIEFSPNNRFVYVSAPGDHLVFQFDLSLPTIFDINNSIMHFKTTSYGPFALQLAPDGLIYYSLKSTLVGQQTGYDYIGAILKPDEKLSPSNIGSFFDDQYVQLASNTTCNEGLPNFIKAYAPAPDPKCFASSPDGPYQEITEHKMITSATVWEGKYYIGPNVFVEVSNTTLDLTNVDIVFDKGARIKVLGTGKIRANNSVFRACSITDNWHGFNFWGLSTGTFNECTFKNAEEAIELFENANVKITNNLFLNNHKSIISGSVLFSNSITGNTFIIDDESLKDDPIDYYAILFNSGIAHSFDKNISHNDFINASHSADKNLYGVSMFNTVAGVMSNNKFTNLYRAIDIGSAANLTIENNEIEVTHEYPLNYQLRISQSSNIKLSGNQILSSLKSDNSTYNSFSVAIYLDGCDHLKIDENIINGFDFGIIGSIASNNFLYILNNTFKNLNFSGIKLRGGDFIDISCNEVNMNFQNSSFWDVIGISIYDIDDGNNIKIRQNCVYECSHSIVLYGSAWGGIADGSNIDISNNFLYNYERYGMRIINIDNVEIGSSSIDYVLAGKNTFVSNNFNNGIGAVDISSSEPIWARGNFGILKHDVNVTVDNSIDFYSTASCSHQIGQYYYYQDPEINYYEFANFAYEDKCDKYAWDWEGYYYIVMNDIPLLSANYIENLTKLDEEERFRMIQTLMKVLLDNQTGFNELITAVNQSGVLSSSKQQWIKYYACVMKNNLEDGRAVLSQIGLTNRDDLNLSIIENINLDKLTFISSELNNEEIQLLESIDDENSKYSPVARDMLEFYIGNYDYKFDKIVLSKDERGDDGHIITILDLLEIYPNPSMQEINITYSVDNLINGTMEIIDVNGKIIYQEQLHYNSGRTNLNISNFEQGFYILKLKYGSGKFLCKSFVKL